MVAAAQFDAVDAHFARGGLDQALHVVVALRASGAAIGADRGGVGEHAPGRAFHQRRAVDADDVLHRVHRRRQGGGVGQIGADVGEAFQPQGEEVALGVQCEFAGQVMIAAVAVGQEAFRTVVGPFDGGAEQAGADQGADVFGVDRGLHAERAADVAGEHAHLFQRHVHDGAQALAGAEHALAAEAQHELAFGGVEIGDRRAWFHGGNHHAAVADGQFGDVGGLGDRLGDGGAVAIVPIEHDVVRRFVVQHRGAGRDGGAGIGDGGQAVDFGEHRLGCVARLLGGFGDHHGDGVADVAHLLAGQRVLQRLRPGAAVTVRTGDVGLHRLDAGLDQVGLGEDGAHAGHRGCLFGVQGGDGAVRHAAAHHHAVELAGQVEVVGVAALAAQQHRIFLARHRLANGEPLGRQEIVIKWCVHDGALAAGMEIM